MTSLKRIITFTIALVITFSFIPMSVKAANPGSAGYSVEAIIPENQMDTLQSYYDLRMNPNDKQVINAVITNYGDKSINVQVETNNAYTNQVGGIEYSKPGVKDETMKYAFSDIAVLDENIVEVPPVSSVTISVTLTMPEEEYDGKIIGGLVFTKLVDENEHPEGVSFTNLYSYVIGVVLSETDAVVKADFELLDVKPDIVNYRSAIVFSLRNTEPIIADFVTMNLSVFKDGSSKPLWQEDKTGVRVAPISTMDYAYYLESQTLEAGTYLAKIHLESEGQQWDFEHSFTVNAQIADNINDNNLAKNVPTSAFPLWAIILGAFLLILILLVLIIILINVLKKKDN